MSDTADQTLAKWIAQLLTDYTYGGNVREGFVRPPSENQSTPGAVPDLCVFCILAGGRKSLAYKDGGARTGEQYPIVQVAIRSVGESPDDGSAAAAAIYDAIDNTSPPGYFDCHCMSGVSYWKQQDTGHHMWTFDVGLKREVG